MNNYVSTMTKKDWENFRTANRIEYFDYQRNIDHGHVQEIVKFQKEHFLDNNCYFYPQNIVLGEFESKFYVIDGQHRIKSLIYLGHEYKIFISFIKIGTKEYLDKCLKIINTNKPYVQCETNDIKSIEKFLLDTYSIYCKTSEKPRTPNINVNNVIKMLNDYKFGFDIFKKTFDELSEYIKKDYSVLDIDQSSYKKCIAKKENPFYVGLMKNNTWVYAIIQSIISKNHVSSLDYSIYPFTKKRRKIPKTERIKLWTKYNKALMIGTCYTCELELNFSDFECGHVISVFHGGDNNIENLRCLCKLCNNDMGVTNIYDYKKTCNIG